MANTPDRWEWIRRCMRVTTSIDAEDDIVATLLAERDALALECKALRGALRKVAIKHYQEEGNSEPQAPDFAQCELCDRMWDERSPEEHAAGCLAQIKE